MKLIIENTRTKHYLNGEDEWTPRASEARNFFTFQNACQKSMTDRDLRTVLYFPGENGAPDFIAGGGPRILPTRDIP